MTLALPQIPGANLLTHSRMSAMKSCGRRHYYSYELGVRPRSEATALRIGSAVHAGLELWSKTGANNDAIAAATAGYAEYPRWADTDETRLEWDIERVDVACMLSGYFWRWPESEIAEYLCVERSFELPITNPETGAATPVFRVAGKIDGVVRLRDGRIAVLERKTAGEDVGPKSDYWLRLRLDQQISLYLLAARSMGFDAETVLYDVIRKPRIEPRQIPTLDEQGFKVVVDTASGDRVVLDSGKPRQAGDASRGWFLLTRPETPDEYQERLLSDIQARPEFYYARQEIPRLDADLEEFRHELWWQQQWIRESQRTGRWIRNTGSCLGFGRCPYLDVCHNGHAIGERIPDGFERVKHLHPELAGEEQ